LIDDTKDLELQGTVIDKDIEDVAIKGSLNGIEKSITISTTGKEDSWFLQWGTDLDPGVYSDLSVLADDGYGGMQEVTYPYLVVKVHGSATLYENILNFYADDLSKSKNEVTAAEHETLLDAFYAMQSLTGETTPTTLKKAKSKVDLLAEGSVKEGYLTTIIDLAWEYTKEHLDTVDVEVLSIAGFENTRSDNETLYQQKSQVYR